GLFDKITMQGPGFGTHKAPIAVDISQLVKFGQLDAFNLYPAVCQCQNAGVDAFGNLVVQAVKDHIFGDCNTQMVVGNSFKWCVSLAAENAIDNGAALD